jgi:hypothetical protein
MAKEVDEILKTEVSEQFIQGMKDRMVISYYKYGPLTDAYPDKINAIASLTQRLREYAKTGNTEFLMDAANFAMIEFMFPRHPDAYFEGTDDEASPGRIASKTGRADKRDNKEIGTNPESLTAKFR